MPCATLQKFGAKTDFLAVLEALYSQSGSLPCSLVGRGAPMGLAWGA